MAFSLFQLQKRKDSSLSIYKSWKSGDSAVDYYKRLRQAIISAYEQLGECELVSALKSELRDGRKAKMSVIAYAALKGAHDFFQTKKLKPVYSGHPIPYISLDGNAVLWDQAENQHCELLYSFLTELDAAGRQYYSQSEEETDDDDRQSPAAEDSSVRKSYSGFGTPSEIIDDGGDKVPVRSFDAASEKRAAAPQYEPSQQDVPTIILQAKRTAERIIQQATSDAARITEQAELDAAKTRAEAKSDALKAKQYIDATRQKAQEQSEKLVGQCIESQLREFKAECNAETERKLRESMEQAKSSELLHKEMSRKADELHFAFVNTAEDIIRQIDDTRNAFSDHLRAWQSSLFPRDLKPIAIAFADFYRILNVDRLICEEAVSQSQSAEDHAKCASSEETMAKLQRINKSLTYVLREFERGLNGLDLIAFYPQAGEPFDTYRHASEDNGDGPFTDKVKCCLKPGIAKRSPDGSPEEVVLPAVVQRFEEGEEE